MRIAVVGGGPAGLFFAYLWKKRHPDTKVRVFEQNPADVTWGFGVVFSDRALDFFRADAPEIIDVIVPHMESWQNMAIELKGQRVEIAVFPRSAAWRCSSFCRARPAQLAPNSISASR